MAKTNNLEAKEDEQGFLTIRGRTSLRIKRNGIPILIRNCGPSKIFITVDAEVDVATGTVSTEYGEE